MAWAAGDIVNSSVNLNTIVPSWAATQTFGAAQITAGTFGAGDFTFAGKVAGVTGLQLTKGTATVPTGHLGLGTAPITYGWVYGIAYLYGATTQAGFTPNFYFGVDCTGYATIYAAIGYGSNSGTPYTTGQVTGLWIADFLKGTNQTVTTQYGVYIATLAAGGTNYSIYTGTSPSHFGGAVTVVGATTLDGGAVTYGANDSAGAGYRTVRVPNA